MLNSNTVAEDPKITRLLGDEHKKVVAYVNQVIGTSTEAMTTAEAPVQGRADHRSDQPCAGGDGEGGAGGRQYAALPVLSQASLLLADGGDPGRCR